MLSQDDCNPDDPRTAFAWMFAGGIPDPRETGTEKRFHNQPLIPPQCFAAVSQMLWDFGCRFHPDLQTKWIKAGNGPLKNFEVWDTVTERPVDISGDAAAMLADIAPDVAAEIDAAAQSPEKHAEALKKFEKQFQSSLARLEAARQRMEGKGGDSS